MSEQQGGFWDSIEAKLEAKERVKGFAKVKKDFYRSWGPGGPKKEDAAQAVNKAEEDAQESKGHNEDNHDNDEANKDGRKRPMNSAQRRTANYKKQKIEDKRRRGHMARPAWDNLCGFAARDEACPFQEKKGKCQYSHDTVKYVEDKPLRKGMPCPSFAKHKFCKSGIRCLFGEEHTKIETKQSDDGTSVQVARNVDMRSEEEKASAEKAAARGAGRGRDSGFSDIDECNYLRPDLVHQVRKKKYDFSKSGGPADAEPRKRRTAADFANKIYIAPLTTVGNLPFRRVVKDLGADITCGEMALAKDIVSGSGSEWALLRRHKCEDFFGVQIAGSAPKLMREAATLLDRETTIDFIDVNLGCPIDLVTDMGAGSALMTRVTKLRSIAEEMLGATQGRMPIGLKMRAGWSSQKFTATTLASEIQGWRHVLPYGSSICYTAVHGRSRQARYTSTADWDYIQSVAARPIATEALFRKNRFVGQTSLEPVPVFGNGDILCYSDWEDHMSRVTDWRAHIDEVLEDAQDPKSRLHLLINQGKLSAGGNSLISEIEASAQDGEKGTDAAGSVAADLDALQARLTTCMIGRGALIKPWISTEIKEKRHWDISGAERMEHIKSFVDYGLEHWGSDLTGVNKTRRFLLEWLSFTCRYVPVGVLDPIYVPQHMNDRPPCYVGRDDKETLLSSTSVKDWVKISELFLGPAPEGFVFEPKHKSNSYSASVEERGDLTAPIVVAAPGSS
ncbi:tRNA-dihydrouridine47 synthase NADP+ [Hondaea fermentalgiana]|uniref:tRNA-dihydrouridine(47) synthase [NAD(P)(+)] n=1 Tax=Hondaea fermentalgiana TaxID=2315210 RepID=A0A2R5GXE1_9STRA|nr:tRNA-dihydrouridine47 synthase NADP+ [Hondaea fermentalgiana]|eukprot:GBG32624.1 tRNA-dihydrouridine47 synthase NADP+ [Hondaea fermentalgiana]